MDWLKLRSFDRQVLKLELQHRIDEHNAEANGESNPSDGEDDDED